MSNIETVHAVFGTIWAMFNDVRKDNTDEGWAKCVSTSEIIVKKHPEKMFEKVILAVIEEAEAESKIEDNKEKNAKYREAAKAFSGAWRLYESLVKTLDINAMYTYCNDNPGKMANKLAAAVYEAACGEKYATGSFMKVAYDFYEEFKDGIPASRTDEAYEKAERIIDAHPEHMLQMMEMYHDLKELAAKPVLVA